MTTKKLDKKIIRKLRDNEAIVRSCERLLDLKFALFSYEEWQHIAENWNEFCKILVEIKGD